MDRPRTTTQRRVFAAEMVRRTLEAACATGQPPVRAEKLMSVVCDLMGWCTGRVWVLSADRRTLHTSAVWGREASCVSACHLFHAYDTVAREFDPAEPTRSAQVSPDTLVGEAALTGRPTWCCVADDVRFRGLPANSPLQRRALFAVPIRTGDGLVVLEFLTHDRCDDDPQLSALVTIIAAHLEAAWRAEPRRGVATQAVTHSDEGFDRALERARRGARRMKRLKRDFLANVSHELRTPISAVIGMIELALGDELSPQARDCLQTAGDSARVMLSLVNNLLDQARLESGKFDLDREPFRIRRLLTDAMRGFLFRAHESGLALSFEVSSDTPDLVEGDARRFRQLTTSLVDNAIKFTERGGVAVRIGVDSIHDDEAMIHCVVSDTGIGVAPANRRKIFAPFVQADSSMTRRQAGAGLGLAIAREIAERMDGRLWFEQGEQQGATFHFVVRLRTLPDDGDSAVCRFPPDLLLEERTPVADEANEPPWSPDLDRPLRVLVVEDTPANQKVVQTILQKQGYHVQVAANGREGLEIYQRDRFDLVLMDLQMPAMDGFQTTTAIRALDDHRKAACPIVAMTANAMSGVRWRCLQVGMNEYIEKPIDAAELIALVERTARPRPLDGGPEAAPRVTLSGATMESPLGIEAALKRLGGDRGLLRDVGGFFLEDAPQLLVQLRTALQTGDAREVERTAHCLKGLAANFNAVAMQGAAHAVERLGRSATLGAASPLVDDLERELVRTIAAVKREVMGD